MKAVATKPQWSTEATVLSAVGVSKRYGGVQALREVSLDVKAGEVHALVGENGAGKSTLVKIIAGMVHPDTGHIVIDGETAVRRSIEDHVAMVHQELTIVPHLSILDNVLLGNPDVKWLYRRKQFRTKARECLAVVGLSHLDLNAPADQLSVAERQLLEMARVIARNAKVLILDEPTATLTDTEIEKVFQAVRQVIAEGRSIIYISHRFREIFALCDRLTTMRNGKVIGTHDTAAITQSEVIDEMLGHDTESKRESLNESRPLGQITLEVENLNLVGQFADINFTARRGEIISLVGQLGSGADEIARALGGLRSTATGSVKLLGVPLDLSSPRKAQSDGVSYVSDDRAGHGVFVDLTCRTNITSTNLGKVSRNGLMRRRAEINLSTELAQYFRLAPSRLGHAVNTLSGGNQQKVSLAKAVSTDPRVLVLNEPTRGVDIGARTEIYEHLRTMAADGVTVILYTSDLSEALDVSDTIVTIYRGAIVRRTDVHSADQSTLLQDILHPIEMDSAS